MLQTSVPHYFKRVALEDVPFEFRILYQRHSSACMRLINEHISSFPIPTAPSTSFTVEVDLAWQCLFHVQRLFYPDTKPIHAPLPCLFSWCLYFLKAVPWESLDTVQWPELELPFTLLPCLVYANASTNLSTLPVSNSLPMYDIISAMLKISVKVALLLRRDSSEVYNRLERVFRVLNSCYPEDIIDDALADATKDVTDAQVKELVSRLAIYVTSKPHGLPIDHVVHLLARLSERSRRIHDLCLKLGTPRWAAHTFRVATSFLRTRDDPTTSYAIEAAATYLSWLQWTSREDALPIATLLKYLATRVVACPTTQRKAKAALSQLETSQEQSLDERRLKSQLSPEEVPGDKRRGDEMYAALWSRWEWLVKAIKDVDIGEERCANPECRIRGRTQLKVCRGCGDLRVCSKTCHEKVWTVNGHRGECDYGKRGFETEAHKERPGKRWAAVQYMRTLKKVERSQDASDLIYAMVWRSVELHVKCTQQFASVPVVEVRICVGRESGAVGVHENIRADIELRSVCGGLPSSAGHRVATGSSDVKSTTGQPSLAGLNPRSRVVVTERERGRDKRVKRQMMLTLFVGDLDLLFDFKSQRLRHKHCLQDGSSTSWITEFLELANVARERSANSLASSDTPSQARQGHPSVLLGYHSDWEKCGIQLSSVVESPTRCSIQARVSLPRAVYFSSEIVLLESIHWTEWGIARRATSEQKKNSWLITSQWLTMVRFTSKGNTQVLGDAQALFAFVLKCCFGLWNESLGSGSRSCQVSPKVASPSFSVGPHNILITNVALAPELYGDGRSTILIHHANVIYEGEEQAPTTGFAALASLTPGSVESAAVNVVLNRREFIYFEVQGDNEIHLFGHYLSYHNPPSKDRVSQLSHTASGVTLFNTPQPQEPLSSASTSKRVRGGSTNTKSQLSAVSKGKHKVDDDDEDFQEDSVDAKPANKKRRTATAK
ncbi:hypothetical protein BDZ89DRAFT_1043843 [Hymenopellis radicata]|nr:hypothetical protein BDZ89DRAFT_1043843 [Hymenopellis radicata]